MLVEAGDLEVGAQPNPPAVRLQLASEQLEERALPGTVGADDPDPIASLDPRRERQQDGDAGEALGDLLGLDHQPATDRGRRRLQPDGALRGDDLPTLGA